jgi:glycosidase
MVRAPMDSTGWWHQSVIYQVYPRSFQDSDGDGEGDLRGIASRLEHVARLGADAVWLSPVYPSPMADGGYDVSDYMDIHPRFGTLADFDGLAESAHGHGLRLLMDVVPCHTSIEHPWFREHPERYVWADGDEPPNNWLATFGGRAWSRDERTGRWYLHSFYPEQPDLDWRREDVRAAMGDVLRFWRARGVDGFRLDALDRLLKDPQLRDDPPATEPYPLPFHAEHGTLQHLHSLNAPDIGLGLAALREAGGDAFLVGEVYLPSSGLAPYLEHLDASFSFELFHSVWDAASVRTAIEAALSAAGDEQVAWVLSNHDFPRLPTRVGEQHVRAAALLLLTLPGIVFIFQGDEIGMGDGPGRRPPDDRAGRDPYRHPMQWDASEHGGFTTGTPWLPSVDPQRRSVAAQEDDPDSVLALYRELIAARRDLAGDVAFLDTDTDVVAFTRGEHVVALNLGHENRPAPPAGAVVRATSHRLGTPGSGAPRVLAPGEGFVAHAN